jgi:hypothetical protein
MGNTVQEIQRAISGSTIQQWVYRCLRTPAFSPRKLWPGRARSFLAQGLLGTVIGSADAGPLSDT